MPVHISSTFDSGNIEVLTNDNPADIQLAIRKDTAADFLQWFHFRLHGARQVPCTLRITNASQCSYSDGWKDYSVATSVDRKHWFRTPAVYDGQSLSWQITPETDSVYFAYFAPYSLEQHADLIAAASDHDDVSIEVLGQTTQGRDLDCIHIRSTEAVTDQQSSNAAPAKRLNLWAIARQHPGETMAHWWIQGWLERLLDPEDAVSAALRRLADIHVVPNMNPDGSWLGNLRTNARGANLNREWLTPTLENSPEVYLVRQCIKATGVDLSFDVHGDEALPYNFIAGTEGIPGWNQQRDNELITFKNSLAMLNPDFQTTYGYPRTKAGGANLSYCSNYLAETFGCLALTMEMPFKDTANCPRPTVGWSPERCINLGRSCVDAAYQYLITKQAAQ